MKVKVSEATNLRLDWMVAKAQGYNFVIVPGRGACHFPGVQRMFGKDQYELMPLRLISTLEQARDADYPGVFCAGTRYWCPSTDWSQGGPIINTMRGLKLKIGRKPGAPCYAHVVGYNGVERWHQTGKTALIAAMRCFVASKLGDEVEVPDELA